MEPERKIEKWLRAYAKKRRSQAGESFKLDPATRRLLQGEIARANPQPDDDDTVSLWQVFRQAWVYLLGFAVCIFCVATLFFSSVNVATKRAQMGSTMANLKQINAAMQMAAADNNGKLPATLDSLTNGYLRKEDLTDASSDKPFMYLAAGKNLNEMPTNGVVAYSPEEKGARAVLFADGRIAYLDHRDFVTQTNQESSGPVLAMAAAPEIAASAPPNSSFQAMQPVAPQPVMSPPAEMPAGAGGAFYRLTQPSNGGTAQTFASSAQFDSATKNAFQNTISSPQAVPVLVNFQVQQNGNAIRVLDQDGSVYSGSLLAANNAATDIVVTNNLATDRSMAVNGPYEKSANNNAELGTSVQPPGSPQVVQNYSFQVNGFNRTLKKSVEFTGNLLAGLAAAQNVQMSFGETANALAGAGYLQSQMAKTTNQVGPLPWSGLRISGTAIINRTNEIQINATPVAPVEKH